LLPYRVNIIPGTKSFRNCFLDVTGGILPNGTHKDIPTRAFYFVFNSVLLCLCNQGDEAMATGFQGKFHRQNMLSRLTKDLVRRSRSKCELCGKANVKLVVYELPPLDDEPYLDGCIFICESCHKQIIQPQKMVPAYWRCLNHALWSEVPVVQVMSVRMLRRLVAAGQHWAEELLEHAYIESDLEAWSLQAD
jgi:protein PhnA